MQRYPSDTIVAIATPSGEGAIGIVRVSGGKAIAHVDTMFRGKTSLADAVSHTVHHGGIVDAGGNRVDDVLATVFKAPHSYTGEDIVEISCHGGVFVTNSILHLAIAAGARHAEPGEFTKRAYLNRKLDLSQAEAVADIIAARSARALNASLSQLEGRLARQVAKLREELLGLSSLLELDIDFTEEGLEVISPDDVRDRIDRVDHQLKTLEDSFTAGKMVRDGVSVVFAGKPNVGKSSIFNALLKEERAIVTHIPGTTRDFLEESISMKGIEFRLVDTAGLRASVDPAEAEGISRSKTALRHADIVAVVLDSADGEQAEQLPELMIQREGQRVLFVRNKIDLLPDLAAGSGTRSLNGKEVVELRVSAKTGQGLDELRTALCEAVIQEEVGEEESVRISNIRHLDAVRKARGSLGTASQSMEAKLTNEFIAFDVKAAADALSEITGELTTDEVLNNIFSRFCVGK